jgi:16S rRNA (guanine1516-N2)-methyltransferase
MLGLYTKMTIAIHFTSKELQPQAEELSQTLHLPIASNPSQYDYLLYLSPDYLGLKKTSNNPFYIDFLSPPMQFRQHHASLKKERLARAMGLKKNSTPTIIDATGGLGRDSFILASLGFAVTILERSPIIHALLQDGIERAKGKIPAIDRLTLLNANAITWLPSLPVKPDIIYLDPMFEERKKSARPKKEMLIFHDIVGDDEDAATLLTAALACARHRVVVKRPRLAQPLNEITPAYSLNGSSCRFDIYIGQQPVI